MVLVGVVDLIILDVTATLRVACAVVVANYFFCDGVCFFYDLGMGAAKTLQPACRQATAIGGVLRDIAQHSRSAGAQASSVQRPAFPTRRPILQLAE